MKYREGSEEFEAITFDDFPNHCKPRARERGDTKHKWSLEYNGHPVARDDEDTYLIYAQGVAFALKRGGVVFLDSRGLVHTRKLVNPVIVPDSTE